MTEIKYAMPDEPFVKTVPFSKLVAVDEINARGSTREGLDELAASIAAKGLIQPIAVRPSETDADKFEVIDGRRRYMAMAKLVKAKTWPKSILVPIVVRNEDNAEALETSLIANTVRLPMHPVDQHEVFAKLSEQGKTDAEIASRFGIAEKTVKQHKALGKLAPEIRQAWRKGAIDDKAAKAFTLHDNQEVQVAAFEKLKKTYGKHFGDYAVRNELAGQRMPVTDGHVEFVGLDAYRAAGGTVSEDLFDDANYIDDGALLKKLVRDKLEHEAARIKTDGWAWVMLSDDAPSNDWDNRWQAWPTVKDDDEDFYDDGYDPSLYSDEEKARSGCVIEFHRHGAESLIYAGLIKPDGTVEAAEDNENSDDRAAELDDDVDEPAAETDEVEEADGLGISGALSQSLSEAKTVAAAKVLAASPLLALQVAIAALGAQYKSAATLASEGHPTVKLQKRLPFHKTLPGALEIDEAETLLSRLAELVAASLDLTDYTWQFKSRESGVAELIEALDGEAYVTAAREAFNPPDYFKRASKAVAEAALREMEVPFGSGGKKAELATAAAEAAVKRGWLPPQLRHPSYALLEDAPKGKSKKAKVAA